MTLVCLAEKPKVQEGAFMTIDNFADERDFKLLEQDRFTFFVLKRILALPCELILSDHKRLIICLSSVPFPVWIWTADDATPEEMEKAYALMKEKGYLDGTHTFNMKYELAEFFIKKSTEESPAHPGFAKFSIQKNMFAYDNPKPIQPASASSIDGHLHQCQAEDIDELFEITKTFHKETDVPIAGKDETLAKIEQGIKDGLYYFWKNQEGKNAACCIYRPNGDLASLGLVFTRPEYRRRHYAENLVYGVTKIAQEKGYLPMLYTDADYAASNACYEKIGYILRGKLCTIGVK